MRSTAWVVLALGALGCAPRLYGEVEEVEPWSAPENTWPLETPPADLVGTGLDEGQTALDVRGFDQFGQEVSMWQFWGRHVLLDIGTGWCAPCIELGKGTEGLSQEYLDEGLIYLTVLHENYNNEPPSLDDLNAWAELPARHHDPDHPYDLITAPIVSDPFGESGSIVAIRQDQYPAVVLIGPDMQVMQRIEPVTEAYIAEVLEEVLRP